MPTSQHSIALGLVGVLKLAVPGCQTASTPEASSVEGVAPFEGGLPTARTLAGEGAGVSRRSRFSLRGGDVRALFRSRHAKALMAERWDRPQLKISKRPAAP